MGPVPAVSDLRNPSAAGDAALTRYRRLHAGFIFPPVTDLADESFTPEQALELVVLEAIDRINREFGTTSTVIAHNAVVGDMADRVVQLGNGQIVAGRRPARQQPPEALQW